MSVVLAAGSQCWGRESAAIRLPGARSAIEAIHYPSIQAAFDALPDEGGVVNLPPGTFEISEPLKVGKGDVLVWHHNLLHGGSAIEREGATRRSMVAHYFGEGALCYHEITERPALIPARQPAPAES